MSSIEQGYLTVPLFCHRLVTGRSPQNTTVTTNCRVTRHLQTTTSYEHGRPRWNRTWLNDFYAAGKNRWNPSRPQTLFKSATHHQHQLSWIGWNWYWVHTSELIGRFKSWLCSWTNHWTESCLPINLNNHKVGTTRKLRAKFCHYCAIFFVIDLYGDRCEYTMIQITLCWILKLDVCCVPSWHGGAFCWGLRCPVILFYCEPCRT